MANIVLSARNIVKNYSIGHHVLEVLKGITVDFDEGEITAVVGESGVGKSTLLHLLGALDRPTSGELLVDGEDIAKKSDADLAYFRNQRIGFIFQFHHLLPEFNALENVLMPALIAGNDGAASQERAKHLLARVGLSERMDHRPGELSGGELQRVAVARALINEPALVLADEPSGNLDHANSEKLHELIWDIAREHNCSFVIVTHDMLLAGNADRVLHLTEGIAREVESVNFSEHFKGYGV